MNKIINFKGNRGVMSLIVILGIGFFVLAIVLTLTGQIVVEMIRGRNTVSGNQSFFTAEAASREGIYQRINYGFEGTDNFPLLLNDISTSSISFEVTTSTLGWAYREAKGDAQNANYRKVKSTILLFPSALAFDYAIYSEGDLGIVGSVDISGDVFSNSTTSCTGAAHNINGDIFSVGSVNNCNATSTTGVEPITSPVINPYDYGIIATCTSAAANVATNCLSGPTTGVVFVDDPGNTAVVNGADLTGNLTVIGNLQLGGNSTTTASNNYAAIVVDGNLTIVGTVNIYGIVYVTGSTTFSGGTPTIYGSLISTGGTTVVAGNVTVVHVALSDPPAGFDTTMDPQLVGWQQE